MATVHRGSCSVAAQCNICKTVFDGPAEQFVLCKSGAQQGKMLLQGTIDRETGQAELQFIADFMFTAGFLYKAPPLKVSEALFAAVRQHEATVPCSILWEAQS